MASQGPNYPATVTTTSPAPENANDWLNPTNVGAADGAEASITAATYDSPDISFRLNARNYGFTIPAGATIDGVLVEINKRDQAIGGAVDFRVQLQDGNGNLVGTNKADTLTDWPTNATTISYGGAADGWNASLTPTLVNGTLFGVIFSAQATAANTDIFVDFIRVTVYYTAAPAGAALEAAVTLAVTVAAALTTQIALEAAVTLSGNGLGVLTTQIPLEGSALLEILSSPALTTEISMLGTGTLSLIAAGDLTTAITMNGTSLLEVMATGSLGGAPINLDGSAILGILTNADLTTQINLNGQATLGVSTLAVLTTGIVLSGAVIMSVVTYADLTGGAPLDIDEYLRAGSRRLY